MPVLVKALIETKYVENAQFTQYTAVASRVIVDAMTLTNNSGADATVSVHIVPNGNAAGAVNRVVNQRTLAAGESYTCPEIRGHVLEPGDFISTLATVASAVTIRATGREIT